MGAEELTKELECVIYFEEELQEVDGDFSAAGGHPIFPAELVKNFDADHNALHLKGIEGFNIYPNGIVLAFVCAHSTIDRAGLRNRMFKRIEIVSSA